MLTKLNISSGEWATVKETRNGVTVVCDCNHAAIRGLSEIKKLNTDELETLSIFCKDEDPSVPYHAHCTLAYNLDDGFGDCEG